MDAGELQRLRHEYSQANLSESEVAAEPVDQFRRWFDEALAADLHEPNAMGVATVSSEGRPSVRVVLLKQFDERGFVFHTNYDGRKAREVSANPNVALLFYWGELERQVRVEGRASRLSEEESDAYFESRPRGGHIGAWASRQSRPIASREALEEEVRRIEIEYDGRTVPRPPFWGGFRVEPQSFEFWQGRESRLHDRLLYTKEADGWGITRLQP